MECGEARFTAFERGMVFPQGGTHPGHKRAGRHAGSAAAGWMVCQPVKAAVARRSPKRRRCMECGEARFTAFERGMVFPQGGTHPGHKRAG